MGVLQFISTFHPAFAFGDPVKVAMIHLPNWQREGVKSKFLQLMLMTKLTTSNCCCARGKALNVEDAIVRRLQITLVFSDMFGDPVSVVRTIPKELAKRHVI